MSMLWRSDKEENRPDTESKSEEIKTEKKPTSSSTISREELLASDPEALARVKEFEARLNNLRKSVKPITDSNIPDVETPETNGDNGKVSRSSEDMAVINKAREDVIKAKQIQEEQAKQAALRAKAVKEAEEKRKRALEKKREAELLAKEAEEASRRATLYRSVQAGTAEGIIANGNASNNENVDSTIKDKTSTRNTLSQNDLRDLKEALENAHAKQDNDVDRFFTAAGATLNTLNKQQEAQKKELTEAQAKAKALRDKQRQEVKMQLAETRAKRIKQENESKLKLREQEAAMKKEAARKRADMKANQKAEAARLRAEKAANEAKLKAEKAALLAREQAKKKAEENRIKEERKEKARKLWRERDEKRQAKRRQKRAEKQKAAEEKLRIYQEIERYRREKREEDERIRLQKIREEDAAKGGGIVTVHDVEIKTEINKRENISFRDLLGLRTKAERKATTEEERYALRMEREYRREDARRKYSFNRMIRMRTWENSKLGKNIKKFEKACDEHKRGIVTAAVSVATGLVLVAAGISYWSAYEYSYNGTPMGVVKSKQEVLSVTNLVEGAVSEDNKMDVVIQPEDITFKRVFRDSNTEIHSTEDVLNRLTYMSDFKIESYGIFVDGNKVGAVREKDDAQKVLKDIKDKYTSDYKNSEIEEAIFIEDVKVTRCTTKLGRIKTADEMLTALTANTDKETVYRSVSGDTVESVAKIFNTTEENILKDNSNLKKGKLAAGTAVVIKEEAPVVTVRITEKVSYTEDIDYKTEKTKDDTMYEGDEKVTQEGKKGSRNVVARVISTNGTTISREDISSDTTKEPVTKKVTVGTKERPPTVGDGKFTNPIHDTFHKTTGFQMRWGRFHKGIDLACSTGTKVHAADGGTVITASYKPSYGNLVVIDHKNGYTTKYAHNSKILVNVGDEVYEGQVVALVGSTGNSTGPHCHFEVRYNDVPKNPLNYISLDDWKNKSDDDE